MLTIAILLGWVIGVFIAFILQGIICHLFKDDDFGDLFFILSWLMVFTYSLILIGYWVEHNKFFKTPKQFIEAFIKDNKKDKIVIKDKILRQNIMKVNNNGDVNSIININGDNVYGRSVIISGNKIVVDGKDVTPDSKIVNITITGDIDNLDVDYSQKIEVIGNINKLNATSADISVTGNSFSIKTTSGDIECGNVNGDIITTSGDVTCGQVRGSVRTTSGDIMNKK